MYILVLYRLVHVLGRIAAGVLLRWALQNCPPDVIAGITRHLGLEVSFSRVHHIRQTPDAT